MKKAIQIVLLIFLVTVTTVTIISGVRSSNAVEKDESQLAEIQEYPEIGYLAPAFDLTDFNKQHFSLKDYLEKPVILNFWASWCLPCIEEAPNFVKIHSLYNEDVQILTINLTNVDSVDAAKAFAEKYGFEFPTLLDLEGTAAKSYMIKPIPTTFFINTNGIITDGVYGGLTLEDLEARTKQLIQEN